MQNFKSEKLGIFGKIMFAELLSYNFMGASSENLKSDQAITILKFVGY
jgi:hypothetical protein